MNKITADRWINLKRKNNETQVSSFLKTNGTFNFDQIKILSSLFNLLINSFWDLDRIVVNTFFDSSTIKKKYSPFGGSSSNFSIEFIALLVSQLNLSIITTRLFILFENNLKLDNKVSIWSFLICPDLISSIGVM